MKKLFYGLALALALFTSGCGTTTGRYDAPTATYDPNAAADPVVVTAQQTRAQALDTFDLLWTTERAFRAELWKKSPEIKRWTDYTRKNAGQWIDDLSEQIHVYQMNRTDANKMRLQGVIEILKQAITQAGEYIATAKTLTNQ